ncbi:unnamed protein product [Ixodes hexagonus]
MKKVVLKPVEGPQKSVELKIGKTIIGRGPLLECFDKKVSRNHAILEVTADCEVILTPTHVNPCFYQAQNKGPSRVMKKDKQHVLASGDSIALLPTSYKYIVEVVNSSTTSPSSQVVDDATKPAGESEEKDSLADKPATAAIPAEEAKKNGSAESHHNSSNSKDSVIKAKNGERGSSKEASPEVCRKPATQAQQKKASDESKAKPKSEGKRTLPRWLVESACKSPTGKPKPLAQPRGKPASVRDEPAAKTRRTSVPGKEPAKHRGKPSAKASESESGEESKEEEGDAKAKSGKFEGSGEEKSESEEEYTPKAREEKAVTGSREPRGSRGGRSSRQNRSTMQKISLDDFVASDDDEWDNSAEEKKPRRRRKRAAAEEEEEEEEEDSCSDWEEENCKTKRVVRRYVPSDSDSASDWERSSSLKKKPVTRTRVQRKRRRRSSSERVSSEAESDDAPLKRPTRRSTATKRESCKYGKKCYRKSGQHLKQFSHPGDSDYAGESEEEEEEEGEGEGGEEEEGQNHAAEDGKKGKGGQDKKKAGDDGDKDADDEEDNRPLCRYGADCFRKNALHLKNFKHPTPTKKAPASQTAASKKGKRGGKAKGGSSNDEKVSGDEYDWKDEDSENGGDNNDTKEVAKTFTKRKPRASERPSAAGD